MTGKNKVNQIPLGTAKLNKVGKWHRIEPYQRDATAATTDESSSTKRPNPPARRPLAY